MLKSADEQGVRRLRWLYIVLILAGVALGVRLFQLQIIQYSHFKALAANAQQRKYEVPAERGQIFLYDGETKVPLAMNQTLKVLYADPTIVGDKKKTAQKLAAVTGDPADKYLQALNNGTEYAQLKTKVDEKMAGRIKDLKLRGIGLADRDHRVYPEGQLGSQILGFVNGEGNGQYGIEGYMNKELKGTAGLLNAKTDTNGVPIATADNLNKEPVNGSSVVLTIDRNIQAQAEKFLSEGVKNVRAASGSILVMDPNTGAVKAMANYPTYDPNEFTKVRDYRLFENPIVTNAFEPGSGFKVLTMAAGLDSGKISKESTFNDSGCTEVTKIKICNAANHKAGPNTNMTVVMRDSLNTGMVYILRSMGTDPTKVTSASKKLLHGYITGNFGIGKKTGIEQSGEATGVVNPPTSNDVNYANMTFGQGISTTMIQMTTAVAAVANGGKLYKPYVVDRKVTSEGAETKTSPKVLSDDVISDQAAKDTAAMMQQVVERGSGYMAKTPGYNIAGKTGTAQIPNPTGRGYLTDTNIGTFVGFAPTEDPKFVVMVRINRPQIEGFAEKTTVPVFSNLTRWLLQYYAVPPSS